MTTPAPDPIRDFLAHPPFAVVGASRDRSKYGNKCLRAYMQAGLPATPVHPRESSVEGLPCAASLMDVSPPPGGVSIVTPPSVAVSIVEEAAALGIRRLWFQPGAESSRALERAAELGVATIAGGPCLLVALRYRESAP
jgi:uncharacterized protein